VRAACRSTGWLTWWGQSIANSSVWDFLDTFDQILRYNNNMGSVTLYMAAGGTNFAYTAGAALSRARAAARSGGWNHPRWIACALTHCVRSNLHASGLRRAAAATAPGLSSGSCAPRLRRPEATPRPGRGAGAQVDPIPGDVTWDWEAGELMVKGKYNSVITSYDYASPISEAGDFCQPGINGPCKWDVRAPGPPSPSPTALCS